MKKYIKNIICIDNFIFNIKLHIYRNYVYFFLILIFISLISVINEENILNLFGLLIIYTLLILYFLSNDNRLLLVTILSAYFQGFLTEELFMPSPLKYIPDFFAFLILIKCLYTYFCLKKKMSICFINKYILLIAVFQIISFIFNDYNIIKFLWASKNWYRFIIIFFGAYYLDIKLKEKTIINIIKALLIMQVMTTIYEFKTLNKIFMDNPNDRVSGLFGNRGTGIALILLTMLLCFSISRYIHRKDKKCINVLVILSIIGLQCVLGELRAAFILIPGTMIFMMIMIFINKMEKKCIKRLIFLCLLFTIGIGISFSVYVSIYKNFKSINEIYSVDYLNKTLNKTSYNSDGVMVNRLNGCRKVTKIILKPSHNIVFGVGIGNASPSTKEYLKGNYYEIYGYLRYYFFYMPYYLAENGYAGTFLMILMIFSMFFNACKLYRKSNKNNWVILGYQGCIFIIASTLIYNSAFGLSEVGFTFWTLSGLVFKNYKFKQLQE